MAKASTLDGRTLFITGRLAEPRLRRLLEELKPPFAWETRAFGSVAALLTVESIGRRLAKEPLAGVARVVLPGLCGGDVEALAGRLGIGVARGPKELSDLPDFLQSGARHRPPIGRCEPLIFAEITDAPLLSLDALLEQARRYVEDGADVIDLGSLPGRKFPHMEDAVAALAGEGFKVSVDSGDPGELARAGRAGVDYILSLNENTLWVADELSERTVPVLIPADGKSARSLYRAIDAMLDKGRPFLADSVLDPIHMGFTESLARYRNLRRRYRDIGIMMGTGNLSELTEADTTGVHAMLLGIASELRVGAVLTTEVSPHARSSVYGLDRARRIMHGARADKAIPKGYGDDLAALSARRPFTEERADIDELAAQVRDGGYRVRVIEDGVHVFNNKDRAHGVDPFALFPNLSSLDDDPAHAFYMGVETARAQIAWQLGKRYHQDRELEWGAALPPSRRRRQEGMATGPDDARSTWRASQERARRGKKDDK